ncbi:[protein-PII] uridylyltransferase [Luteimonas aquatica]|uniref:[protein-PII] uridylyltransferase n=1 Tax=Luteimonas aquatica TaxID=450364 RepID=UPI001F55CEE1|nr:[protein-PII] uridylyltransferase [Luteimonas aquatica]
MSIDVSDEAASTGAETQWAQQARAALAQTDARLAKRFDQGERVERLVALRARAVDELIRQAWARCVRGERHAESGAEALPALFAVGGYGRGELFPQSDIDLLVLAEESVQHACGERLSRFFASLWDAGLQASHAVRSLAQCTQAAADQTVLTALLEARPLAARDAERAALAEAIAPDKAWPAREFFLAKVEEQRRRHARFGDTSDNLEPNLKDGPGGLRDLQTLGWMALRSFGVRELEPLIGLGHLGADEATALERERRNHGRLRYGLHLIAGRHEERLGFDYQKALAARLGYADDAQNLGVEQMMQGFYRSAAIVRRISERLLQRFEEHFDGAAAPTPLDTLPAGARFESRRDYLAASDAHWPHERIDEVFALFAAWAAHDGLRGLHSQTARALAEALPKLPAYDQTAPASREAFMALLRGPQPVKTLERMARLGVLGRWLPAFAQVSGRMQFDLFHVYTVDQHTLAVLRNLAAFSSGGADERFSMAHEVWPTLRRPELLLLAGLFHDIAKGRGGDHSELGADDARAFCQAHGLSESDTALVEWLVRKHLLMSVTAQKQDISDPAVIHRFAAEVAERERLDYLYLLTCADIAGTSPKLWNAWKDRLLADLRISTRLALRQGLEHPVAAAERIEETRAETRRLLALQQVGFQEIDALFRRFPEYSFLRARPDQIAWQALALRGCRPGQAAVAVRSLAAGDHALEVFVHSPDRDGLFAAIVITLDRLGLAIQQARALDGPGETIFDNFQVLPSDTRVAPDLGAIERRLREALDGPLERIQPARRAQPRHLRHFRLAPRISFDAAVDGRNTVLSLICNDRPGLLADIAHALRSQRVRVHDARIATFGERAEDVFRISDTGNRALDETACAALHTALLVHIDGESPP